jgi:GNAT superfamily N-acetyltransferase
MGQHPLKPGRIRVPVAGDAERVARFVNTRGADLSADFLARWWRAAERSSGEARLVETENGALLGYGFAYPVDLARSTLTIDLRVDPTRGGDAVTGALLDGLEPGIERLADAAGRGRAVVARGRVEVIDGGSESALQSRGYRVVGGSFRVGIDFTEPPPEPGWPPGTEVRTFRPGLDDEAFHGVLAEAFEGSPAMDVDSFDVWTEQTRADDFDPTLWFLATCDGEAAAAGLAAHHRHDPSTGWIPALGVRAAWRRHRVGQAMMQHMFGDLYRRGARHVGGAVDFLLDSSALQFDLGVGMHVVEQVVVFEREVRRGRRAVAAAAQIRRRLRRVASS